MARSRLLSMVLGVFTVCLVAAAAGYLVTHPGRPQARLVAPPTPTPAASQATPAGGGAPEVAPPPNPSSPVPAIATPLSAPEAPPAAVPQPKESGPAAIPPGSSPQVPAKATPDVPAKASHDSPATATKETPARAAVPMGRPEFRVQAGAFKNREYADDLVRQLRANGYTVTVSEGSLVHVYVGPAMSRAAAERLAENLRSNGFEAAINSAR